MRIGAYASTVDERGSLNACEQAGVAAEQASGLPTGLLLAIGRVESGRWDAARGRMTAWPWTINAAGKGQWFDSADAAAGTVRALLDAGVRSIDVGCFQINLMYHPQAFASPAQGFDPEANARYAARFLLTLFARTGSWEAAVEAYHSADPELGFAYRQQVFSIWSAAAALVALAKPIMPTSLIRPRAVVLPLVIAGVQIWTPMPAGMAGNVVAMPTPRGDPASGPLAAAIPTAVAMVPPGGPLPVVTYRAMPRR